MNKFFKFFDKYSPYLPINGEGNSKLEQMVTAVNKICYNWLNNGDVYDNTYNLGGWYNNLSTYANWLYAYTTVQTKVILDKIKDCQTYDDYDALLYELCEELIRDSIFDLYRDEESIYSIYKCEGHFQFKKELVGKDF